MRPLLLALLLALPAPAQESVGGPVVIVGPDAGAYAVELKATGAPVGVLVLWRVDANPPGLFTRKVPATRSFIVAGPPGTYTATAEVYRAKVKDGAKGEVEFEQVAEASKTFTLTGGAPGPGPGPQPVPPTPPGPTPPGPTPPAPDPNPMPGVTGLHMLVVYESGDLSKYPASQVQSWHARKVFDYLTTKGAGKNWRVWDRDTQAEGDDPKWQAALARAKGKQLPWVIISNGQTGYDGPAPANADALLALLQKYGN